MDRRGRPIIILGAARSGTKLLRELIGMHPSIAPIPYDVNFVWKYGNYQIRHDELSPRDATPVASRFIRAFFERFNRGRTKVRVVEKTVSNTVRVAFVREVFPSCQFVHLVRDGRDVAASAQRQWLEPLPGMGVLWKLKDFPIRGIPNYAVDYIKNYCGRWPWGGNHLRRWGVVLKDLDQLVSRYSVLEVCGIQWSRCVEQTVVGLEGVAQADVLEVRYEELVRQPARELERLMNFVGAKITYGLASRANRVVSETHVGKWRSQLSPHDVNTLTPHIRKTMATVGYCVE